MRRVASKWQQLGVERTQKRGVFGTSFRLVMFGLSDAGRETVMGVPSRLCGRRRTSLKEGNRGRRTFELWGFERSVLLFCVAWTGAQELFGVRTSQSVTVLV